MSSRSLQLLSAEPDTKGQESTLIDRYAGREDHARRLNYPLPESAEYASGLRVSLVDTGEDQGGTLPLAPHESVLWHLLWAKDESIASATVDSRAEDSTWAIAPGDLLHVPPGATLRLTRGQLGLYISTRGSAPPSQALPPTHGTDDFFGFNRRTMYPLLCDLATFRWKVTKPLDLANQHVGPVVVVALAGDFAIATPGESLTLRRGQAVLASLHQTTMVYPDGLAYIFVIEATR